MFPLFYTALKIYKLYRASNMYCSLQLARPSVRIQKHAPSNELYRG